MRPLTRVTSIAAAATLAGLLGPAVATAEDDPGEITVAAAVDGSTVTMTVTDTYTGEAERKACAIAIVDPSFGPPPYGEEEDPLDVALFAVEGGVDTHDFTDVPDGEWRVDYVCMAFNNIGDPPEQEVVDFWLNNDYGDPWNLTANRDPIYVTVGQTPEEPDDPGCFGSACLFTGSS